jgi:2-polyprenyl-3-methyl-5-hydroxy-6-metoxy-1,4-benzoquinol methylase
MIVCPKCRQSEIDPQNACCKACGWHGTIQDGIPHLIDSVSRTAQAETGYEEHYEALAESDLGNPIVAVDWLEYQARNLVRYMGNIRGASVCDIGCGRGILARLLAKHGAAVTAVDMSISYLKHLSQADTSMRVLCCDADNLPFEDEFDAVVSTDVMEHTLRPGGFLYSVNHALKPGGKAYIRVPYKENLLAYAPQVGCAHPYVHLRSYNKALLRHIFSNAGFKIEQLRVDGFSLGTPWPWFLQQDTLLGGVYATFVRQARKRIGSDVEVNAWPPWFARIFMRPLEVVVCAKKTQSIVPAPGGTVFRLTECAAAQ